MPKLIFLLIWQVLCMKKMKMGGRDFLDPFLADFRPFLQKWLIFFSLTGRRGINFVLLSLDAQYMTFIQMWWSHPLKNKN